jgi:hypothetical protein
MQRIRERLAAVTFVLTPVLAWGLLASTGLGQAGGGGAGQAGGASSSQQSSPQPGTANQQPGQQSSSQPGAARQGDPTSRTTPSSPGAAPPTDPPTGPGAAKGSAGVPRSSADTGPDPNRAVRGADRTRSQDANRTGQTQRRFDFGGQLRSRDNNLIVGTVREDGFFHNAGIEEGDQIISVNGQNVTSDEEFRAAIAAGRGRVPVTVMRDGERQEIVVNLDEWNAQAQGTNGDRNALGIWFFSHPRGAYVAHVMPGSPADRAGLRRGDWVVALNGAPCHDWQAIQQDIGQAEAADLQVWRNGETMRMKAEPAHASEVFPEAKDWNTIAAEHGYQRGFDQQSRYMTGQGTMRDRRGGQQAEGAYNGGSQGDTQRLERRIRELEREVADLREQLNKGASTSAPDSKQNNGQRTDAPPNGQ